MYRYRISEIKTDIDTPREKVAELAAIKAGLRPGAISDVEIRRMSIDSRKKPHIQLVYTVDFSCPRRLKTSRIKNLSIADSASEMEMPPESGEEMLSHRPVVIGAGPCGLFAGLELARLGYRPLIIERGPCMEERVEAVERFRESHILDPEANMLFGEGGAGTFSDGKIGTGIRDGLIRQVLTEFRDAGAGDDIMYLARPHIGTDVLRGVIVNIRKKIEELGGEFRFNTRLESFIISSGRLKGIAVRSNGGRTYPGPDAASEEPSLSYEIPADALILAIGHSARDTFAMIRDAEIGMEQKPFSIGVRIEHPQRLIDIAQYGEENAGKLPPADYKLSYKASNGRGVYSFCMCPGGEVVVCSTEEGKLCVNGMSSRKRDSGIANSGILCDVRVSDFGSDDVLAGVRFQEKYERLAFINGGSSYDPPRCLMKDFLGSGGRTENEAAEDSSIEKERSGSIHTDDADKVRASLPGFASEAIREAIHDFARRIKGYDDPEAVITAVETRSSSPVRILRNREGESNIRGIYPAGEGAGYAGGITSAACDGIRAAWHIVSAYRKPSGE